MKGKNTSNSSITQRNQQGITPPPTNAHALAMQGNIHINSHCKTIVFKSNTTILINQSLIIKKGRLKEESPWIQLPASPPPMRISNHGSNSGKRKRPIRSSSISQDSRKSS
ncbi:hypothetical protein QJS04_geneDACA009416 [Acorus gramineus]|uniref:Uncharacterized protein n=1 Tax=Acorus gramineus TaxID=55184 RepID=A0AAV9AGY6_ACOGR|nr:hypothetical protein QJS04_geneDACA009416 [Acorus gramineus]